MQANELALTVEHFSLIRPGVYAFGPFAASEPRYIDAAWQVYWKGKFIGQSASFAGVVDICNAKIARLIQKHGEVR